MSDETFYNKDGFLESPPAGFDGIFDWAFLRGALPRGIMPMDIDANIECNNNFLWFETKRPDIEIPKGQRLALKAHWENGHTVIVTWGKSPQKFVKAVIYGPDGQPMRKIVPQDGKTLADAIYDEVQRWGVWADANPYFAASKSEVQRIIDHHKTLVGKLELMLHGKTEF